MLNEQNVENKRQRFLDDLGTFFAGYGLTATLGRILGYLMLREGPASLDDVAADLGVSKSGVSTAVRKLETWGMVRRATRAGSRRLLVEANSRGDLLLAFGVPQLERFARTLHEGAEVAPAGLPARRVENLARTMDLYLEVVNAALERVRREPPS